jgi:hypothetical protein
MFEMLLCPGKTGQQYFPNSGPGTKFLKTGNEDIGWFGQITGAELFQGWEVSQALNLTAGLAYNDTNSYWLKFIYKGKFLFIASQPTRRNLSWNDVYSAGGIYGVKGNGAYPMPGNAVDQWRVMMKEEAGVSVPWKFSIRSLNGAAEPFNPADTNVLKLATGNEHNDLLYRLVNVAGLPNTGVFEQWGYTALSPSTATATILKESSSTNTANAEVRIANGTTLVGAKNAPQATDAAFRPVLELLDDATNAYGPYRPYTEYTGNNGPLSLTGVFADVVYNPSPLLLVEGGNGLVYPTMQSVVMVDAVHRPRDLSIYNPIYPVSMSFTNT